MPFFRTDPHHLQPQHRQPSVHQHLHQQNPLLNPVVFAWGSWEETMLFCLRPFDGLVISVAEETILLQATVDPKVVPILSGLSFLKSLPLRN